MQGETALHRACMMDLGRLVTKLLESGANPNIQTISVGLPEGPDVPVYRQSPLHVAISAKNLSAVNAFLEHKGTIIVNLIYLIIITKHSNHLERLWYNIKNI